MALWLFQPVGNCHLVHCRMLGSPIAEKHRSGRTGTTGNRVGAYQSYRGQNLSPPAPAPFPSLTNGVPSYLLVRYPAGLHTDIATPRSNSLIAPGQLLANYSPPGQRLEEQLHQLVKTMIPAAAEGTYPV